MTAICAKGKPPRLRSNRFWRALMRFGSPRFTSASVVELARRPAANDEQCTLCGNPAECESQLEAC